MTRLLYFAWVKEKVGKSAEEVALPSEVATVAELIAWLKTRGPEFANAFECEDDYPRGHRPGATFATMRASVRPARSPSSRRSPEADVIKVQHEAFDIGAEIARLTEGRRDIGAIVTFTGTVRDQSGAVDQMSIEHYPGMTESELAKIEAEACARWPLQASLIVHRHGTLKAGDNIVLVVTASAHRDAAFDAARFLMDYLKSSAPFWKRESGKGGSRWVEASANDESAVASRTKPKHAAE